ASFGNYLYFHIGNYQIYLAANLRCNMKKISPSMNQVLQATVMKQLEIADSVEEVILSKLHRRRFCA
uniref:Uncharacterized protein n=1 Tax=Aegilops tauschii subsp. strangulata TaxID=200361 RepID=A0A453D6M4_AEGTS